MTGQHLPGDVELGAERLGDTEDDTAQQRSPHAAQSAEDNDLEGDQQAGRAGGWIEVAPDRHAAGGDGDRYEADAHGHGVDAR